MSSAKHFFLKFTERDRPTVKPTETSRGRISFSQLRDKGTLCVRESVLLGRKEVVSIVDRSLSPGPQNQKRRREGRAKGGSMRAWACWEESTSTSSTPSSTSTSLPLSSSSYPSLSRSFYLSIGFYISQPSSRCNLQPALNTLYKLI